MATPTRQWYLAAAVLAVVCGTSATYAADAQALYQQAITIQSGEGKIDLKAAQDLFEKAAAAGSTMAMQRLGDMYHDGDGGVTKDFAKAMEWYQKEAAMDDSHPGTGALGMFALGELYEHGRGMPQDHNKANEWFDKALKSGQIGAAKGDNSAMIGLALCLAQGKGTDMKPDPVNAWSWAIKSSQTPNPWAYELMASLYNQGIGVTKDPSAALRNLFKAAQMGVSQDMLGVSICYASGTGVKKDQKSAVEWVRKAVERGNGRAMAVLGRYYHEGIGLERSDTTAREWYQKAVDQGDESALGYMGDLLIAPGVNPRDSLTAMTWFEKGAKAGDAPSMFQLANLLAYDPVIPHDIPRAVELLMQSSNLGYSDSTAMMGEFYARGLLAADPTAGVSDADRANALSWFRKAAEAGSPMGMRDLGEVLTRQADGKNAYSIEDDNKPLMAEAFSWLQKAANAGDTEALADIGDAYESGKGPNESTGTAIVWYKKAALAGSVRAMRSLGTIFKDDRVLTDYAEAKKWFETGSGISAQPTLRQVRTASGDPACMSGLAEIYDRAMGVPEDNVLAYELYLRASQLNDGGGFRGIAQYFQEGRILELNLPQAAAYYDQAAQRGDMRAMESLGRMFELGQGVEKDMARATALFTRAKELGSLSAWNWVFSHSAISATMPAGSMAMGAGGPGSATRPVEGPPLLDLIAKVPSTQPTTQEAPVYTPGSALSIPGATINPGNNPGNNPGGVTRGGRGGGGGPGGGGPGGGGPGGGGAAGGGGARGGGGGGGRGG